MRCLLAPIYLLACASFESHTSVSDWGSARPAKLSELQRSILYVYMPVACILFHLRCESGFSGGSDCRSFHESTVHYRMIGHLCSVPFLPGISPEVFFQRTTVCFPGMVRVCVLVIAWCTMPSWCCTRSKVSSLGGVTMRCKRFLATGHVTLRRFTGFLRSAS